MKYILYWFLRQVNSHFNLNSKKKLKGMTKYVYIEKNNINPNENKNLKKKQPLFIMKIVSTVVLSH